MQMILIFLASIFFAWSAGDYHGHRAEKNSIENAQKSVLIKDQQLTINKLTTDISIRNNTVNQLINDKIQERNNYIKVLGELSNAKTIIDRTNHINGSLVQYVQAGVRGKTVPEVFDATSRVNAESETYSATDYANSEIMLGKQCNDQRDILIRLQQYIKQEIGNYNAD